MVTFSCSTNPSILFPVFSLNNSPFKSPNMVSNLHIAVLAFPFGTHAAPLITLVRKLAATSPDAKFSFFNSKASNSSISSTDEHANIRTYDVWDGTPEGFVGTHFEQVGLFLKASPHNFDKAIEEAEIESGLRISCLISDAFLWFACDLAEERGVPWVAFWTAGSCSLSAHIYTDEIQNAAKSLENKGTGEKTVAFIPGLSAVHLDDLPPEVFLEQNPTSLARTIYNMVQKVPKSTAVVLNSFEEIDPFITDDLRSKFQHFLNVGPSILSSPIPTNPDDENGCLPWLEKQNRAKSVIYISFGTVVSPPPNEMAALAEALEACRFPFLWSIKDHSKKFLPEGFLERTRVYGKIVAWAPQLQVLQQSSVGVFITHCGWNSILESISGGVPLMCRPFFGDQKLNGRMVEDVWEIGVRVKGGVFSKSDTINSLNYLMLSEDGKAKRENVNKLRERAENAVKVEGSSSKNFKTLLDIITTTPKSN